MRTTILILTITLVAWIQQSAGQHNAHQGHEHGNQTSSQKTEQSHAQTDSNLSHQDVSLPIQAAGGFMLATTSDATRSRSPTRTTKRSNYNWKASLLICILHMNKIY